jgi:hypothetical protein
MNREVEILFEFGPLRPATRLPTAIPGAKPSHFEINV